MVVALPAALALPVLAPLGCDREGDEGLTDNTQVTTDIEEIEEEPGRHFGKSVKVVGEIDDVYGQRAFELEGLDLIFEDEVLVLTKSPIALGNESLQEDQMVRVHGTVKKFSKTELESELGWKLDGEVNDEWEGKPVIVADAIDAVRRYARWSESDAQEGEIVGMYAFYTSTIDQRPTLDKMAVTFEDTVVNQVKDGKVWVGWSHPGVMVVPAGGLSVEGINKGDLVDISGRFMSIQQAGAQATPGGENAEEDEASQAEPALDLRKLGRDEKMALQQDGVYIQASSITKSHQDRAAELTTGATEANDEVVAGAQGKTAGTQAQNTAKRSNTQPGAANKAVEGASKETTKGAKGAVEGEEADPAAQPKKVPAPSDQG